MLGYCGAKPSTPDIIGVMSGEMLLIFFLIYPNLIHFLEVIGFLGSIISSIVYL